MSVPGIGPITVLAYVSAIENADRFRRSRLVGAHLGLMPRQYQSGDVERSGHVSKCGETPARLFVHPDRSPRGSWFSPRSACRRIIRSEAQALQCPQRARGGCPPRSDGFRRSSLHPRPGGQAHRIVVAVRICLTTSGGCFARGPAERFASAPDAVLDNRQLACES
jgi:hypothetical protein